MKMQKFGWVFITRNPHEEKANASLKRGRSELGRPKGSASEATHWSRIAWSVNEEMSCFHASERCLATFVDLFTTITRWYSGNIKYFGLKSSKTP